MNFNKTFFVGLAALGAAFFLASCGTSSASMNPGERPRSLRYCFTSTAEEPDAASARLEVIQAYLSRTLHMPVEVTRTSNSYGAAIEAFRANKIDVASISPFSYVIATQKVPIEAILMRDKPEGGAGEYNGVLAVPGNSPIHTVADLLKHSKELTLSFVDPASTSGFLVQSAFFQSQGMDPERDFKKIVFSMNHIASLMTIKGGNVDVAACSQKMLNRYFEQGLIARGDIRVLWVSPSIPNQPIAARKSLPEAFKKEIQKAFMDMPTKDPVAWKNLYSKKQQALVTPGTVYVPANDAMFDGLRQIARGAKNLNLLEQ